MKFCLKTADPAINPLSHSVSRIYYISVTLTSFAFDRFNYFNTRIKLLQILLVN